MNSAQLINAKKNCLYLVLLALIFPTNLILAEEVSFETIAHFEDSLEPASEKINDLIIKDPAWEDFKLLSCKIGAKKLNVSTHKFQEIHYISSLNNCGAGNSSNYFWIVGKSSNNYIILLKASAQSVSIKSNAIRSNISELFIENYFQNKLNRDKYVFSESNLLKASPNYLK